MSCATKNRLSAAFTGDQNTRYHTSGFMLDAHGYVQLLVQYQQTFDHRSHPEVKTGFKTLTLSGMEQIGRAFRARFSSDDQIYTNAADAATRATSLGYVCYQMLRRLKRLEHEHFGESKKLDYTAPLDAPRMADIIRAAINGEKDQRGFLLNPLYNEIRAAEIQVAHPYDTARRDVPTPAGVN